MPLYKYIANRLLTAYQNFLIPFKLSEYHSGYRAFSRKVLENLPLEENSDDFIFDNQMLVQVIAHGFSMGEVSCPTRYIERLIVDQSRSLHKVWPGSAADHTRIQVQSIRPEKE